MDWVEKVRTARNGNVAIPLIRKHFQMIFSEELYPFDSFLTQFVTMFPQNHGQKQLMTSKSEKEFLTDALNDLDLFLNRFTFVFVVRYWGFTSGNDVDDAFVTPVMMEGVLRDYIRGLLFKSGLYSTIVAMYQIQPAIKGNNAKYSSQVKVLHSKTLKEWGVPLALCLPYDSVIQQLIAMDRCDETNTKNLALNKAFDSIQTCIDHASHFTSPPALYPIIVSNSLDISSTL